MYRKMYEWVLKERKNGNFEFKYDLNPQRFEKDVDSILRTMISDTLLVFYGFPTLFSFLITLYKTTEHIINFIN